MIQDGDVLRDYLITKIAYHKISLAVTCDAGCIVIDVTKKGHFCVELYPDRLRTYKKNDIDELIQYCGEIKNITLQDYGTNEEVVVLP